MAKRWEYRPAGFEEDSDDDDFMVSGDQTENPSHSYSAFSNTQTDPATIIGPETTSKQLINHTQPDEFEFSTELKSVRWRLNDECRAAPVIKLCGKSLSFILLDDLRRAAIRNDVNAIEALLQAGVDIESRLNTGWTVLMHAVNMANADAVHFLLERGANSNGNKDGLTVLMAACGSVSHKRDDIRLCFDMLLDKGAEINKYDRSHRSALMYAARGGHAAIVQRLIERGAEINEQDQCGYTALMHAAEKGHASVVQLLLKAKADVSKVTTDGDNAADLAFLKHHKKLQQMLDNHMKGQGDSPGDSAELEFVKDEVGQGDHWSYSKKEEEVSYISSNLDLFLSSLGLNELNPILKRENMTFEKFLRIKDHELVEMGIHQLGVRKKILDALKETHKRNWETSSLIPIDHNKKLTVVDAAGMIANAQIHATYIASTIGYMSDQVSADNAIVVEAPEKEVEDLCINAEETIANVRHVYKELRLLRSRLRKICLHHDFSPPDLVKPLNSDSRLVQRHVILAAAALGCVLVAVWFRRQTISSVVSQYIF